MTELEKEAEEKYSEVDREFIDCQDEGEVFNIGYILGAEPREKRIAELEKEVTRLRNENLDIINKYTRFAETDRRTIAELEAQIEKMKCCKNCLYNGECDLGGYEECRNFDKWEIKEK